MAVSFWAVDMLVAGVMDYLCIDFLTFCCVGNVDFATRDTTHS